MTDSLNKTFTRAAAALAATIRAARSTLGLDARVFLPQTPSGTPSVYGDESDDAFAYPAVADAEIRLVIGGLGEDRFGGMFDFMDQLPETAQVSAWLPADETVPVKNAMLEVSLNDARRLGIAPESPENDILRYRVHGNPRGVMKSDQTPVVWHMLLDPYFGAGKAAA